MNIIHKFGPLAALVLAALASVAVFVVIEKNEDNNSLVCLSLDTSYFGVKVRSKEVYVTKGSLNLAIQKVEQGINKGKKVYFKIDRPGGEKIIGVFNDGQVKLIVDEDKFTIPPEEFLY